MEIIKSDNSLKEIDPKLIKRESKTVEVSYPQRLAWWNNLSDDWKQNFLMKNQDDDNVDTSIIPSENFLDEIFNKTRFYSMWLPIKTLSPLCALLKLETIYLEYSEVSDFKEISTLNSIKVIIADNSKFESLEGLENFELLEKLTIVNTDVTTLKPIATLKNIKVLDIRGTLILPEEVEYFKQLHPLVEIYFITSFHPLRRNKESLESPLLDFFRNLGDEKKIKEEALFKEGVSLIKSLQYKKAILKFDEVINLKPKSIYYLQRGVAKQKSGDFIGAIMDLDLAIEGNVNNKDLVIYFRGTLKMELKKYNEALIDFEEAILLNPKAEEYYLGIKEIYNRTKNVSGVIRIMDNLIRINPSNPSYYYDRGVTYGLIKNYKEVINNMDKVIQISPNDSEAFYNRGVAKLNLGNKGEAYIDLKKSKDLGFLLAEKIINENY